MGNMCALRGSKIRPSGSKIPTLNRSQSACESSMNIQPPINTINEEESEESEQFSETDEDLSVAPKTSNHSSSSPNPKSKNSTCPNQRNSPSYRKEPLTLKCSSCSPASVHCPPISEATPTNWKNSQHSALSSKSTGKPSRVKKKRRDKLPPVKIPRHLKNSNNSGKTQNYSVPTSPYKTCDQIEINGGTFFSTVSTATTSNRSQPINNDIKNSLGFPQNKSERMKTVTIQSLNVGSPFYSTTQRKKSSRKQVEDKIIHQMDDSLIREKVHSKLENNVILIKPQYISSSKQEIFSNKVLQMLQSSKPPLHPKNLTPTKLGKPKPAIKTKGFQMDHAHSSCPTSPKEQKSWQCSQYFRQEKTEIASINSKIKNLIHDTKNK